MAEAIKTFEDFKKESKTTSEAIAKYFEYIKTLKPTTNGN